MNTFWLVLGFSAQALFSARFLIQWVASEKAGRSIVPNLFWHFSLAGSSLLLIYSIYRKDPVFIIGQSAGLFIYTRNLFFIKQEKRNNNQTQSNVGQNSTT
jgi:lipid-A-disaccharide synthase-like uncharacterized protein